MTIHTFDGFLSKLRRAGFLGAAFASAGLLGACAQAPVAPAPGADPLVISQSTNNALRGYLADIYPNRRGAFAVSADGANSFAFYCPDIACPTLYGGVAVSQCESLSGQECNLFYVADRPRIAYTVASDKGTPGRHGSRKAMTTEELTFHRD